MREIEEIEVCPGFRDNLQDTNELQGSGELLWKLDTYKSADLIRRARVTVSVQLGIFKTFTVGDQNCLHWRRPTVRSRTRDVPARRSPYTAMCSPADNCLSSALCLVPSVHNLPAHPVTPLLISYPCLHNVHKQADKRPLYRQLHCNIRCRIKRVQNAHKTRSTNTSICCRI